MIKVAVEPDCWRREALVEAVEAAGGAVAAPGSAEALVWAEPARADLLPQMLNDNPKIDWVQLPYAGIEPFLEMLRSRPNLTWTCGKGVYAAPVAEHALALALAGLRGVASYANAKSWSEPIGKNLFGANITILGGGGITEHLIPLLKPFDCKITVVRNQLKALQDATEVVASQDLHSVLPSTDLLVLALALTPETEGIIGATELTLLPDDAWIINVARGGHLVTEDLVKALREGSIGGAALDVTDPEPLPDGHPLWSFDNCLITPHIGNTPEMGLPLLAQRVTANVRRRMSGADLIGLVDVDRGY